MALKYYDITRYRYPLDTSGKHPTNRIEDEVHQITSDPNTRTWQLEAGAFYTDSVKIYHVESQVEGEDIQYLHPSQYGFKYLVETAVTLTGLSVASLLVIKDTSLIGTFRVTYQCVGREYEEIKDHLVGMMETVSMNNKPVFYENIVGRPEKLYVPRHLHHYKDIHGAGPFFHAITALTNSLQRRALVVDTKYAARIAKLELQQARAATISREEYDTLVNQVNTLSGSSTSIFDDVRNRIDGVESATREATEALRSAVTEKDEALQSSVNEHTTSIDGLKQRVNDLTSRTGLLESFKQTTPTYSVNYDARHTPVNEDQRYSITSNGWGGMVLNIKPSAEHRQFSVAIDSLNTKTRTLEENIGNTSRNLGNLTTKVSGHTESINGLVSWRDNTVSPFMNNYESTIRGINDRHNTLAETVSTTDSEHAGRLSTLEHDAESLTSKVDNHIQSTSSQNSALNERINAIERTSGESNTNLQGSIESAQRASQEALEGAKTELNEKIDGVEDKLGKRITTIDEKYQSEVLKLSTTVNALPESFRRQITETTSTLNQSISTVNGRVTEQAGTISQHTTDIEEIKTKNQSQDEEIQRIKQSLNANNNTAVEGIGGLTSRISGNEESIRQLQQADIAMDGRVDTLESKFSTVPTYTVSFAGEPAVEDQRYSITDDGWGGMVLNIKPSLADGLLAERQSQQEKLLQGLGKTTGDMLRSLNEEKEKIVGLTSKVNDITSWKDNDYTTKISNIESRLSTAESNSGTQGSSVNQLLETTRTLGERVGALETDKENYLPKTTFTTENNARKREAGDISNRVSTVENAVNTTIPEQINSKERALREEIESLSTRIVQSSGGVDGVNRRIDVVVGTATQTKEALESKIDQAKNEVLRQKTFGRNLLVDPCFHDKQNWHAYTDDGLSVIAEEHDREIATNFNEGGISNVRPVWYSYEHPFYVPANTRLAFRFVVNREASGSDSLFDSDMQVGLKFGSKHLLKNVTDLDSSYVDGRIHNPNDSKVKVTIYLPIDTTSTSRFAFRITTNEAISVEGIELLDLSDVHEINYELDEFNKALSNIQLSMPDSDSLIDRINNTSEAAGRAGTIANQAAQTAQSALTKANQNLEDLKLEKVEDYREIEYIPIHYDRHLSNDTQFYIGNNQLSLKDLPDGIHCFAIDKSEFEQHGKRKIDSLGSINTNVFIQDFSQSDEMKLQAFFVEKETHMSSRILMINCNNPTSIPMLTTSQDETKYIRRLALFRTLDNILTTKLGVNTQADKLVNILRGFIKAISLDTQCVLFLTFSTIDGMPINAVVHYGVNNYTHWIIHRTAINDRNTNRDKSKRLEHLQFAEDLTQTLQYNTMLSNFLYDSRIMDNHINELSNDNLVVENGEIEGWTILDKTKVKMSDRSITSLFNRTGENELIGLSNLNETYWIHTGNAIQPMVNNVGRRLELTLTANNPYVELDVKLVKITPNSNGPYVIQDSTAAFSRLRPYRSAAGSGALGAVSHGLYRLKYQLDIETIDVSGGTQWYLCVRPMTGTTQSTYKIGHFCFTELRGTFRHNPSKQSLSRAKMLEVLGDDIKSYVRRYIAEQSNPATNPTDTWDLSQFREQPGTEDWSNVREVNGKLVAEGVILHSHTGAVDNVVFAPSQTYTVRTTQRWTVPRDLAGRKALITVRASTLSQGGQTINSAVRQMFVVLPQGSVDITIGPLTSFGQFLSVSNNTEYEDAIYPRSLAFGTQSNPGSVTIVV